MREYALLDSRLHAMIGFFSVVFSAIAYKALKAEIQDEHFLAIGKIPETGPVSENDGQYLFQLKGYAVYYFHGVQKQQFRLSPNLSRAIIFVLFLGLGFNLFSHREINVLAKFSNHKSHGQYCTVDNKPTATAEVRPECRLIYRAFELGYAKDLGSCGKSKEDKPKPCDLRYEDEPFFHFAYRRMLHTREILKAAAEQSSPESLKQLVERDSKRFEPMVKEQFADLNNDPRSYHIVLTNLPPPELSVKTRIERELNPSSCIREYKRMPNRMEQIKSRDQLGSAFHFASGHLLFDSGYATTVANCKEFDFRWQILPEYCQALMSNPASELAKQSLSPALDRLLERLERRKIARPHVKQLQAKEVASIQCISFGEFQTSIEEKEFDYHGAKLAITWKKVSIPALTTETPLRIFRESAHAYNSNFRFSQLTSHQSIDIHGDGLVPEELFTPTDFLLSRLGFLRDADIFIGNPWLLQRSDLLDLYPYYLHLNNFIENFRTRYKDKYKRL